MKGRESVLNYSQSEMNFMRQDALRRTREMHRQNRIDKNNVQAAKMPASHTQEPASGQMCIRDRFLSIKNLVFTH